MAGFDLPYTRSHILAMREGRPLVVRALGMAFVALAFVIAFGVPLLLSGVTGFNLWQGEGQSMQPTFSAGDFVITRHVPVDTLAPGDVVLFEDGPMHVMHRVVEVVAVPGQETYLVTRGDNNPVNDPPVPADALIGKLIYDLSWLPRSPLDLSGTGIFVAEWVVSMVLAATGLVLLRSPSRRVPRGLT